MSVKFPKAPVVFKPKPLTQQTDDRLLVNSLIAGNSSQRAFQLLFDRYRIPLYNKAFQLLNCHFRAEEAVADVFLKVWSNRKALQTCLQLRAYLFRAVHNRCIDYLRKQRVEDPYAPEQLPVHQLVSTTPEQDMVSKELKGHLQEAVNQLPPRGRAIFRLSREEGLTYSEIAEHLGISVKTVETHMRRSLRNLRCRFQ
jgi:RNA polymerase sigma-70 factor, ECF subfamily